MVSFLGPSGCGKTTTLRIVSGFENPTTGEVWLGDKMINDLPPNKRDTAMVFQSYAIFPHLSVGQNIAFGLELKGVKADIVKKEVEAIMATMNLTELYNRSPDQLSGGQQQRVALARSIINKPSVLLFDEPLSNLDAKLRDLMRFEIRRIQQSFGITSIYVTHDQAEAMTVSDRIVVMNEGHIMQVGTPFEIYSHPANKFVADFIGRVNFLDSIVEEKNKDGKYLVHIGKNVKLINSSTGNFTKGDKVLTVIRPESLTVSIGEKDSGSVYNGVVEKAVYLGATVEYDIMVDGREIISAVTHNPVIEGVFKSGDRVNIDFDPAAAHLLGE
jgi:iron(III) transport system ATP-binding protein